jgi:hypothetical protein
VQNLVPFSQLAADLNTANLPNYSFIVPYLCYDAHDCSLSTAHPWLKTNFHPLIQGPQFQIGGLLIIVFDEANNLDFTSGGGDVAAVIVSTFAKRAYKSIVFYQHQSVLRLMLEGLGVTKLSRDAATATAIWEFFNASQHAVVTRPCFVSPTLQTVSYPHARTSSDRTVQSFSVASRKMMDSPIGRVALLAGPAEEAARPGPLATCRTRRGIPGESPFCK